MMRDKPHEESPGDGGSGKQCEEEEEQQHIALWKHLTILHSPEGRRSIYLTLKSLGFYRQLSFFSWQISFPAIL